MKSELQTLVLLSRSSWHDAIAMAKKLENPTQSWRLAFRRDSYCSWLRGRATGMLTAARVLKRSGRGL